jgi:hypothetical protein
VLWKYRPRPLPTVCVLTASAMSFSLPFLPQLTNNITYYGKTTPLLVYNLGDVQQRLGVQYIKYATVHIREHDAAVFYHNPYQNTQSLAAPLAWCLENPGKAALTVALHVFNLLDQDLPFPYSTNLLPWYYPLASLLNLLVVALGFVGVILAPFLIRPYGISAVSLYVIAVAALIGHFGLHSMVMAEARFGVPALLILYAFAAWVVAGVLPVLKPRACGAALAVAGIAALAGSQLSEWVRWQAPEIRMALERRNPRLQETARTVASSAVTGKRFDSPNLPDWTLSEGGVGSHGEAILISNAPGQVSLIQHPVKLDKGTDYIVEFDARAALPPDAYLRADLQAPAYDGPEQESTFMFYGDYRHFSVRWNSGPEAPSDAKLRFRTLSTAPIQIRNITFRKAPL